MKVKFSILTRILAPLLILSMVLTGCSYDQAQVTKAVQNVENGLKTVKSLLPQADTIVQELTQADPGTAAQVEPIVKAAGPAIDKLIAACDQYLANPGADQYQAILNGVDAFTAQVDQQALATLKISNPASQQKVSAWIALVSTGLHVTLGIVQNYATSKQVKAMPQTAKVSAAELRPFINRDYARDQLVAMGYTTRQADDAIERSGF